MSLVSKWRWTAAVDERTLSMRKVVFLPTDCSYSCAVGAKLYRSTAA